MGTAKDALRASLLQSTSSSTGSKEPDGVLTATPDTPGEWRSKHHCLDCVPTTSTYLEDDDDGRKPNELFGKFTWKIERFSEISKRELRSAQFDVGDYKWYILVYPQGCDVCNHLSLFLCVADYDKLLPGWSHFAQFTIAVVNKDPKKSKYSDTLHRFCKKEHDWGWKKFMELSKVLDGFTVADTLVIKAQVQVILDKPGRPFRCLDAQYRRELVRVYLTNVESICRRFCDEKRARLAWLKEESAAFQEWWKGLSADRQRRLTVERGEVVLKGVVKQFFNEKEVTSTLVMDALFAGCRQLEEASRAWAGGHKPSEGAPSVVIRAERNALSFGAGVLDVAERCASPDWIPPYREDKGALGADGLALRSGGPESGPEGEARRDSVDRDERRLGELGRRTVEMLAISHIFCEKLESEYRQYQALKRQEALIAEEEEAGRLEDERQAAKQQAEKEKRAKKKEKQKKRKEEEQHRRTAEEDEKRRAEEERRQEQEQRADERRRQEQEERNREAVAAAAAQQDKHQRQQQQQQSHSSSKGGHRSDDGAATCSARADSLHAHALVSRDSQPSGSSSPGSSGSSSDASDMSCSGTCQPAEAQQAQQPGSRKGATLGCGGSTAGRGGGGSGGAPSSSNSATNNAAAVAAAAAAAAAATAELEAQKRRVTELEDEVAILQQRTRMYEASASSSGKQLGDLQRQVADLSRTLGERDRQLEAAQRHAAGLQQQLEERDALTADLRQQLAAAQAAAAQPTQHHWADSTSGQHSSDGAGVSGGLSPSAVACSATAAAARRPSSSGGSSLDAAAEQEHAEASTAPAAGQSSGGAKGFLNGTGAGWAAAAAVTARAEPGWAAAGDASMDGSTTPTAGSSTASASTSRQPSAAGQMPPTSYSEAVASAPAGPSGAPPAPVPSSSAPMAAAGPQPYTPPTSGGPSPSSGPQQQPHQAPSGDLSIGPSAMPPPPAIGPGTPLARAGSAGPAPGAAANAYGPRGGAVAGKAGGSQYTAGGGATASAPAVGGPGSSTVAQNGVAGVLHTTAPMPSSAGGPAPAVQAPLQPSTPSYRNAAAGGAARGTAPAQPAAVGGLGPVGSRKGAGAGAGAGMMAAARGADPFGGYAGQVGQQAGRPMAFGPMPNVGKASGMQGATGQRQAPASSAAQQEQQEQQQQAGPASQMDDGGAEFLHMSMIDSLLQE